MKNILFVAILAVFISCKNEEPAQSITIDGMTFTLPTGFKRTMENNSMGYDGIPALENGYEKKDGGNTATLKINRFDIAHIANEDPEYLTEMCLAHHRIFYSKNNEETFKYSEDKKTTLGGKPATQIIFEDISEPQSKTKGEMIAVKAGNKIIVLHYEDYQDHFDKAKADWDAIKNSVKIN